MQPKVSFRDITMETSHFGPLPPSGGFDSSSTLGGREVLGGFIFWVEFTSGLSVSLHHVATKTTYSLVCMCHCRDIRVARVDQGLLLWLLFRIVYTLEYICCAILISTTFHTVMERDHLRFGASSYHKMD
mmetsp:Transcript_40706/g.84730  ORF Transcript_40706/g.84730 Transcript_40706/m.84730 type:complete len:130 (-) Transcript_40706:154-543(-)